MAKATKPSLPAAIVMAGVDMERVAKLAEAITGSLTPEPGYTSRETVAALCMVLSSFIRTTVPESSWPIIAAGCAETLQVCLEIKGGSG
jgi:hypothetical protein